MHHVLQLAEITHIICRFLTVEDLKLCILVCRDWWLTFEPLICTHASVKYYCNVDGLFGPRGPPGDNDDEGWEHLDYDQDDALIPRQPSAFSLIRHRQKVRSLESFAIYLCRVPFNNLRSVLLISGTLNFEDLTPWIWFLRGCKHSLQELELAGFRVLPPADFWETLVDLPRFRSLRIQHGWIEEMEQTKAFWSLCSKLETLVLRSTHITAITDDSLYPFPDLSNMKELLLKNVIMKFGRQARIVARCGQKLRRLWWSGGGTSGDTAPIFRDFISSRRLYNLEAVSLGNRQGDVAGSVLSAWLKSVDCVQGMPWSPEILATVHEYIPRLTELRWDSSDDEGCRLALLLLASCPNLRTATTPEIKVSDMVALAPQGWACARRLRRLSVYFEVDEVLGMDREESNLFVLHHLSTLTELEVLLLNSGRYYRSVVSSSLSGLRICLASGLDRLAGLKCLWGVALPDHQPWTRAELDWAGKHWPRLTDLAGINEHNQNAEKDLEDEVNRRGLRSVYYATDFDDVDGLFPWKR
ncbi:hypothetical protein BGZ95_003530 [Linnemannia exigua]|uniref:F-box domain-containing protein n=1 Tax=Linnemannia exigua TaxID=604196 RepID=A0AAD4D436_9FUNG|nr:hypothetical protein BGZ95_003530 [Linnemannia exigua]